MYKTQNSNFLSSKKLLKCLDDKNMRNVQNISKCPLEFGISLIQSSTENVLNELK